ncbi:hypothetical protein G3573_17415 [Caulobacter sp. 17J65-9]|nr:hypothetical protein [Caulobacter sp. 17J65-9]
MTPPAPWRATRGVMRASILACWLTGATLFGGCARTPPPPAPMPVPQSLRAPCPRPDPADVATQADLMAFSLRQEAAIGACEALKDAAVALLDARGP